MHLKLMFSSKGFKFSFILAFILVFLGFGSAQASDLKSLDNVLKGWKEETQPDANKSTEDFFDESEGVFTNRAKVRFLDLQIASNEEYDIEVGKETAISQNLSILINSCWRHNVKQPNRINIADIVLKNANDEYEIKAFSHNEAINLNDSKVIVQLVSCYTNSHN